MASVGKGDPAVGVGPSGLIMGAAEQLDFDEQQETQMKTTGDNMKNQLLRSSAAAGLALLAALTMVPTARAQNYGPWSPPVELNNLTDSNGPCPAVNSTSPDTNDTHPALSKDGLSLYFASTRSNILGEVFGNYHLWFTTRPSLDSCWVAPTYLGPVVNDRELVIGVNGLPVEVQDFAPNLTPDGHWLYFHSTRPGPCGSKGSDLYVSHRDDTSNDLGWGNPANLGCTINRFDVDQLGNKIPYDQAGPTYFEDVPTGTHYLYFTQRLTGAPDTAFDIYVSTCKPPAGSTSIDLATCNTPNTWGPGVLVDKLSLPLVRDTRTAIRRDGLEMILSTGRNGSLLSENLWVSMRPAITGDQLNWETPQPINCEWLENVTAIIGSMPPPTSCPPWNPIDPPGTLATEFINSDAFDGGPALSWDGTELYFFRVVSANNMKSNCTVVLDVTDTDTSPYCRDLFVSRRTYITKTVLNSSANPSVFGQPVTFTATVSSANDSAPTGTVTFSDGPTSLGTGTLASGETTFTTSSLAVGSHSISGQYSGDRISGVSSGTLTQTVEYGVCPLLDQARSVKSGATFPIKLQLCDANGNDLSDSAIVVHAMSIIAVSGFSGTPDAPGNANPDNDFRFDATLGSAGGYIFNLSTGGLASGTYSLQFIAGNDPVTHSVTFGVN
jgi:Big-like domain-containing protein/WD40 repeat protein